MQDVSSGFWHHLIFHVYFIVSEKGVVFIFYSTLKKEAQFSSETSVHTYIPEDRNIKQI